MAPALRHTAAALLLAAFAATAAAAPVAVFRVFNSSGVDVTGTWVSPGISATLKASYSLRLFRDDGGSIASCDPTKMTSTQIKFINTDPTPSTGFALGTPAFKGAYWEIPFTVENGAEVGLHYVKDAAAALTCASGTSVAGSLIPLFNVGYGLSLAIMAGATGATDVSCPMKFDNTLQSVATCMPFNSAPTAPNAVSFELSCAACSVNSMAAFTAATVPVFMDLPQMFFDKGITYAVNKATAHKIIVTLGNFALLPPGVYDIGVKPGVLATAASTYAGGARTRMVYGTVPIVYNAETTPVTVSHQRLSSNLTHAIYVTNATKLGISQIVDTAITTAYFTYYDKLFPISAGNGAEDVLTLLSAFTTAAKTADTNGGLKLNNYTYDASLSEGVYRLQRNSSVDIADSASGADRKRHIVIIIDRTAPMARNATWTTTAQPVGGVGKVFYPTSMFTDSVSADSAKQITVVSTRFIGSDGQGFFCENSVSLGSGGCYATSIRGPSGNVLVEVTAADEAGNQAVAFLTIPVAPALVPVVTVADKRGVFTDSAFKTGGAASLTSASVITFKVVVTFADPVNAATLALTVAHSAASITFAGDTAGTGVSTANGRVVTFTVTATDAIAPFGTAPNHHGESITFSVAAAAATRSADSVKNVAASNTVTATIDTTLPTAGAGVSPLPFRAAVGVPFFAYIPMNVFADSTSAAKDLTITAGTTADVVGLTVTVGKLGRAYISGTAASQPTSRTVAGCGTPVVGSAHTSSWVAFSLTVQDEAGNSKTGNTYCVEVASLPASHATSLSLSRNTLTFAESATPADLDPFAAWGYITSAVSTGDVYKIVAYLETPDYETPTPSEALSITGSGTVGTYTLGTDKVGMIDLTATPSGANGDTLTQAQAITALRSVKYVNSLATLTPGFRTARVVVLLSAHGLTTTGGALLESITSPIVVGSSFKTLYVTNVNNAPKLEIGALNSADFTLTNIAWTEGTDDAVDVGISLTKNSADYFTLSDSDDTEMASATLTITPKDSTPNYGDCDSARDALYLPSAYLPVPKVYGQWNPTACTFTLKPITGAGISVADLTAALHAVVYRNSDRYDPANGLTASANALVKRNVQITVTDAAAAGKAAAAASSAAVTGRIVPTLVDDEAFFVWDKVYGPGGLAYSTNQTSNIYTYKPGAGAATRGHQMGSPVSFPVRKFVLDYKTGAAAKLKVELDLRKVSDRVYAGGAIRDYDSLSTTVTGGADITLSLFTSALAAYTGTLSVPANMGAAGASYSTSGLSSFEVSLALGGTDVGPFAVKVKYGAGTNDPFFYIWIDVRNRVCIDGFIAAVSTASGSYSTAATKAVYDPNTCLATAANVGNLFTVEVVSSVTGLTAAPYGQYVHSPAKTSTAATGSASAQFIGRTSSADFNFFDRNASIFATRHALIRSGATGDDAIRFLASERFANRGLVSFYFERNSFSTTSGSFTLRYAPVGFATALTLPSLAAGEILDANLMFELTPACMQFASPVTVCIYVGDTPAGYTRSLKTASQKSCVDNTRGWLPWEPAAGVTFDAMTGLLCGNSSHFTVFATTLVPLSSSAAVSKAVSMGGSCPNECSGRGFCRSNGVCQCFPGNNGNDCSLRTCPVAESWDAGVRNGHELAECSERGACNTKTGQCACYPGFTGAACQRTACPNDCSGRGQCKLIKDLPQVQAAGYSMWEASRLTKCVCDAGYMGIDCSERVCAFGDDPETTCTATRQVQQVTLDFGSFPASVANPAVFDLYNTDELSLLFRTPFGQNLSVSRISDTFEPSSGADNFARALKALPGFAVSDVTVTGAVTADKAKATYNVTFDGTSLAVALSGSVSARLTATANTVPGNQALFICPSNTNGALGCMAAGCRPKFKQARVLDQPAAGITVSPTALLWQPQAASAVNTVGKWAVTVVVTVQYRAETGVQSFSATSSLWENTAGDSVDETPVPPADTRLRKSLKLVYGLEVDFDSGVILDGTYVFRWRLPSCTVTEVVPADRDLELAECSRRGVCDRAAGTCKCFPGYAGASCGMQTVVV